MITACGGGVPVVRDDGFRGIGAVVDNDRTSQLLASALGADTLVILTDGKFASVNYDGPDHRPLCRPSFEELRARPDAGEFGGGSMQPKQEARLRFVEQGGDLAVITSPAHLMDALAGETGTRVRARIVHRTGSEGFSVSRNRRALYVSPPTTVRHVRPDTGPDGRK